MTITFKKPALILAAAASVMLSACGGAETGPGGSGGPNKEVDRPDPPTISSSTVVSRLRAYNSAATMPAQGSFLMPVFGSATYNGALNGTTRISGEPEITGMSGRLNMSVNFANPINPVSGSVTDINLLSGTTPVERVDGQLRINGAMPNGITGMTGTMSGQLNGVFGDEERGVVNVASTLQGTPRNVVRVPIPIAPTAITGSVDGTLSGSENGSIGGNFYATR